MASFASAVRARCEALAPGVDTLMFTCWRIFRHRMAGHLAAMPSGESAPTGAGKSICHQVPRSCRRDYAGGEPAGVAMGDQALIAGGGRASSYQLNSAARENICIVARKTDGTRSCSGVRAAWRIRGARAHHVSPAAFRWRRTRPLRFIEPGFSSILSQTRDY